MLQGYCEGLQCCFADTVAQVIRVIQRVLDVHVARGEPAAAAAAAALLTGWQSCTQFFDHTAEDVTVTAAVHRSG